MPCYELHEKRSDGKVRRVGFICGFHPVYRFRGYTFEIHSYLGPIPVCKRDHGPLAAIPKGFWDAWVAFGKLDERDKAAFLIDEDNHHAMDAQSKIRRKKEYQEHEADTETE